jgi:transcription-repair coupling factor (superfamily II helicase)
MRDMEIRGAGEILGIAQSGKSKQTGVSLYLKLLENKIDELQSGKKTTSIDVKIELDIEFVLPDSLFAGDVDKIQFYRSIESIEDIEDLESAEASFIRVHGENEAVRRLFLLLRARIYLARFSVSGVKKVLKDYVFEFSKQDTPIIRAFLEIDRAGDFLVQSLERVRVSQKLYTSDLDFLTKLVYSLEHAE